MMATPAYLSDLLIDLQRGLITKISKNGIVQFDRVGSLALVSTIGGMADIARKLECALSQAEWNRRAAIEREELLKNMTKATVEVLGLMKADQPDDETVVQFRPRSKPPSGPTLPTGGNAA